MEERMQRLLWERYGRPMKDCTKQEILDVLMTITKEEMAGRQPNQGKKRIYYISAEFLIGKLLSNNLINLGLYHEVEDALNKNGRDLAEIEEMEMEPSLGNGGLGRLAACFLDSIASLGLPGDGIGLNYHYGLFRQQFENHKQKEVKNPWITSNSWLVRQPVSFVVPFRNFQMNAVMYDIDVPGYRSGCNKLHLFDVDSINESIVPNDSINFDKRRIQENLTLFLYPDDSDRDGRLLRIYQQYFMVCAGAQLILMDCLHKGVDLHHMYDYVAIQINDTHPSMIIPELIRQFQLRGFSMDEAIEVVSKTCAYTNHTILAEALEKWPMDYLEEVVPHLLPIIKELDRRVKEKYDDEKVAIIDKDNRVHMAHMDIHYGYSVNGVAYLHTEILKNSELNAFYKIYPEKFNNKTNGITFRRWLIHCNHELSQYLTRLIGPGFKQDADELEKLMAYKDDKKVLSELDEIKQIRKAALAEYLYESQNIHVNRKSIFDVQVKRLHEYKRQQMNALYAIYKYLDIKAGNKPETPITLIFGAKAAPAYTIAKDIIHLILCLQELCAKDPEVAPYFNIVMIENYNVSKAAKVIPAADVSEQISLASKEASGTGNMKFMLNGAVTIGTDDGANVEIHQLVGDENIYIFGKDSQTVVDLYAKGTYSAKAIYDADPEIAKLVDFITGKELLAIGDKESLTRLHDNLLNKDWFMALLDLKDYIETKERMYRDYTDRESWNRKALINIAKSGFFSSDRTIRQYNEDIWHLS